MLLSVRSVRAILPAIALFAFIGFASASASAAPTFKIGSSLDLESDPSLQIVPNSLGTGIPEDEDGVRRWSLDDPYAILDNDGEQWGTIDAWSVELKEDPFVVNNINITNTTAFNVVYIASVVMPIPAFAYDEIVFSSVGVTATDSNGNNVLLVDLNDSLPFYRGRVNGVTMLPLTPPAIPITTADCSPTPNQAGCTATSATGVASLPVAPDVATEIEILLRFVLSPGDSVGITSRFEIIPEPTTGLLLGLGMAALAVARRRSR